MKTYPTIAIIGSGNMGASLVIGLIADNYPPDKLCLTDSDSKKLKQLAAQFHVKTTQSNEEALKTADIVIFAIKPQVLPEVAKSLAKSIQQHHPLVISIAAGIRTDSLNHWLGKDTAIVRAMPNTPALVGCGASALYATPNVTPAQREQAEAILRAVGLAVWLEDEKLLDAVTAISGSGPAYFFLFMEIMENIGTKLGLPEPIAKVLIQQTALGAARMALESSHSTAELRRQVTSPNGTTEQAIQTLEKNNIRETLTAAITAAYQRADELAQEFSHGV